MSTITLEDLKAHNPALYGQVVAEGIAEGTARERRRLSCILDMASAGQITEQERKALFDVNVPLAEIPSLLEKTRAISGEQGIESGAVPDALDEQVKAVLAKLRGVDSLTPETDPETQAVLDRMPRE